MVEGVLRGLLCYITNDAMNKSPLPAVVRAKEGKRKEGLWGVSGLRLVGWRRAVFI